MCKSVQKKSNSKVSSIPLLTRVEYNIWYVGPVCKFYSSPNFIISLECTGWVISSIGKQEWFKDFRPFDNFDNPYLIISWVTNDNSEHLCALVSGTCFGLLGTVLYLHEHCPYITYYCFFCQSFIIM